MDSLLELAWMKQSTCKWSLCWTSSNARSSAHTQSLDARGTFPLHVHKRIHREFVQTSQQIRWQNVSGSSNAHASILNIWCVRGLQKISRCAKPFCSGRTEVRGELVLPLARLTFLPGKLCRYQSSNGPAGIPNDPPHRFASSVFNLLKQWTWALNCSR